MIILFLPLATVEVIWWEGIGVDLFFFMEFAVMSASEAPNGVGVVPVEDAAANIFGSSDSDVGGPIGATPPASGEVDTTESSIDWSGTEMDSTKGN